MKNKAPKRRQACGKYECAPFEICKQISFRYTHLSAIKSEDLLIFTKCPQINDKSCICNACRQKFSKKSLRMFEPLVWNTICLFTANAEELRFFQNSDAVIDKDHLSFPDQHSPSGIKRRNRRVAVIYILQFILHEGNNYPFHVLTATIIKRLSQSQKLLEILNKIGFACSEDTLARFLQKIQDSRQASGTVPGIDTSLMTCVSIDNIDVLSSFATVVADKSCCWHGTSVMAQQPKPISERLDPLEKLECTEVDDNISVVTEGINENSKLAVKKPSV